MLTERRTVYFVQRAHRTARRHTHRHTCVNIATCVGNSADSNTHRLFICNSVLFCLFTQASSCSQHPSLPHSASLSVSLLVLSISTSSGSDKKKCRAAVCVVVCSVHFHNFPIFSSRLIVQENDTRSSYYRLHL